VGTLMRRQTVPRKIPAGKATRGEQQMYARVTRLEGVEADTLRRFGEFVTSSSGPPEGVPSSGITVLIDPDNGSALVIGVFQTEEDLRTGDEALRRMESPVPGMPAPASIETYEIAAEIRM
jgi:hypothetical protein